MSESNADQFLAPSRWCNWCKGGRLASTARKLKKEGTYDTIMSVYRYVAQNVSYDYEKAKLLEGGRGYIPYPESTYETGKWVCSDMASLLCAMLREVGVTSKLCIGYLDGESHAWVEAWDGSRWLRCDPAMAQGGGKRPTEGHEYRKKYVQ